MTDKIALDYEEVLHVIGDFGNYQKRLLFVVIFPVIYISFSSPISNFLNGDHKHRCNIQEFPNDTYSIQSSYHSHLINSTIPMLDDGSYDPCHVIVNGSKTTCDKWVFDYSVFTNTISSQFNLECESKLLRFHATASYFIGLMTSTFIWNPLGDIIGRRMVTCSSLSMILLVKIATAFSFNVYMFAVLRFLDGIFCVSLFTTTCVIGLELLSAEKRMIAGSVITVVFSGGEFVLVLLAFFIRDWRWLQLALTLLIAIAPLYWWFVVLFIFYGTKLNIGHLGGNIYASFTLIVVAETIGCLLMFTMDRIGHKRLYVIAMGLTCLACLASIFPFLFNNPAQWITVLFALLGMVFVSTTYAMISVYTAELFPTVVRQFVLGTGFFFGGIGSICSPYLYHLAEGNLKNVVPLILYGITSTFVTFLTLLLPETNKRKLQDNVEESDGK